MTRQEQNAELIARHRNGDPNAMGELVRINEGLIGKFSISTARKYGITPAHHDWEDCIQEGRMGLLHAARKYDSSKALFSTYAVEWIAQYVGRYCMLNRGVIHVPLTFVSEALRKRGSDHACVRATGDDFSAVTLVEAPADNSAEEADERAWLLKQIRRLPAYYSDILLADIGEQPRCNRSRQAQYSLRNKGLSLLRAWNKGKRS